MKTSSYLLLICFMASLTACAQLNPQSRKVTERYFPDADTLQDVTPALQKKKGFTDYEELISFLEALQNKLPNYASISYIGESQKGKPIPMLRLTNPNGEDKL